MIELDGEHGEGGGQILRTALGLSVLTSKPFRLFNIRKGRTIPGLKKQHIACVKACAELSNAYFEGSKEGSEKLEFVPKDIKNRQMNIDIGSAGSITLAIQSMLPACVFLDCEIKFTGGTDVKWNMPIDYLKEVLRPILLNFCDIEIVCDKRGYFPKGGGSVVLKTKSKYKRLNFDVFSKFHQYVFGNPAINLSSQGKIMAVKGISNSSMLLQASKVAERQSRRAEIELNKYYRTKIDTEYANTDCEGSGIVLYATYRDTDNDESFFRLGADALGEKGLKAEEVGRRAASDILDTIQSGVAVDEFMQDNLIPFLGLFGGRMLVGKITPHTLSNILVCEKFIGVKYDIKKISGNDEPEKNMISVLDSGL